jgi:hypothetical protein
VPRYDSFHLRYDGGQRAIWGGVVGLAEHFETYASGLPTDPVWRGGGPILVPGPEKDQHVLAWVRGIPMEEIGREGAWQAWGVTGPAGGFGNWMQFWDALAAAPERERLDELAAAFSRGDRGAAYPPVPQRLAHVLAELHSTADAAARRIVLKVPSELPLVPWCCLLGPVAPEQATVGVPRRMKLHVKIPFAYDVSIGEASLTEQRRTDVAASPLFIELVGSIERGELASALETVQSLRDTPLAERRKRIFAPRAFAETPFFPRTGADRRSWKDTQIERTGAPDVEVESETPPERTSGVRWERIFTRTFFGFSVLLIILLQLVNIQVSRNRKTASTEPSASGTTSSGDTTPTIGDTAPTTSSAPAPVTTSTAEPALACDSWWTDPDSRAVVLPQVNAKVDQKRWNVTGVADTLLTSGAWDSASLPIATNLAVQLQITKAGCATVAMDGRRGERTQEAIRACAAAQTIIAEGNAALQWLCTWSADPQS